MAPSFWALCLLLMLAVAVAEERREGCSDSTKRCGNLTISHPFWLRDNEATQACHSSDFEVTCFKSTPVLWSSIPFSFGFVIIDINYEQRSLQVADGGKLYLLHASNSCGIPIWNTSAKLSAPFRINPGNLNLIVYNCTEKAAAAAVARRDRELVPTRMRCGNSNKVFFGAGGRHYDEMSDYHIKGCDTAVVPVLGSSSGKMNASEYEQLISDGFLMRWDPPHLPPPAGKLILQTIF